MTAEFTYKSKSAFELLLSYFDWGDGLRQVQHFAKIPQKCFFSRFTYDWE